MAKQTGNTSGENAPKSSVENDILVGFCLLMVLGVLIVCLAVAEAKRVPNIEVTSMDFTVQNITQTRLSADWDMLIRIPEKLPDGYICLQGDLQASFLYKNITFVTSSRHSYNNLKYNSPQQLRVSASISDEDIGGLIGKNIIKEIKEDREVRFGSRLFLTDCRKNSTGVMSYVCDETTLRFLPGSDMKATAFGNNPTCVSF